jgi:S1-C subfamily serine protease
MLLSLSGCKSFIEPSNKSSKDDDDDSVEVSSDDLDNESLENFRDVNTYDDAPAKNVTEEATEVIDFAKGFYTNWFKMRNSVEEDGEILYKDFKIEDPDYEGFYDLDYPSFYERYASSDEKEDPDYYSMDLIQSDVPSDYYSMPKTWDSVKILSGGDGFYKIGAVFTFEGFTYENGYDYDKRYKNKYYGTLTVIKEQDGWKVDSWTTYAPWDLYEDYRKSDKFLQSFEAKLEGKSQEVDTIIDADVTENSDGVVVESSIIMDESEGAASSPGTDLDLKSIIKENDSKTVAILGDTSQGSGFFLCEGIVVTNVHVIHKQKSLTVRLVDGTELEVAGVVVLNPSIDIAVLKLKEKFGEPVKLGNPDAMTKADEIVAIGSPMGLFNTVTIGLFQNIIVDGDARILQSSLPLAPGNSGGPLFNSKGELIGVNTSIVEGYADISFAMSSYHLVDVKESLDSIDFKKIKVTKLSEIDWEEN